MRQQRRELLARARVEHRASVNLHLLGGVELHLAEHDDVRSAQAQVETGLLTADRARRAGLASATRTGSPSFALRMATRRSRER